MRTRPLAIILTLVLAATACGSSSSVTDAPTSGEVADDLATTERVDSSDDADSGSDATDTGADQTGEAEGSTYIDARGPLMVRQRIDASISTTAQTFELTSIDGPLGGVTVGGHLFRYKGVQIDGELKESTYWRDPSNSPADGFDTTICSAQLPGCVRGLDVPIPVGLYESWLTLVTDPRSLELWPAPIEVINDAAWQREDNETPVGGQPGVCFVATGEPSFAGSPFPAGDRICGYFYSNDGVHTDADIEFVAYDQGGDGTFEVDALTVTTDWSDEDIVLLEPGIDTEPDNEALRAFIDTHIS